jgi:hypothetical protein
VSPNTVAQIGIKQVGQAVSGEWGTMITICMIIISVGNTLSLVFIVPRSRLHNRLMLGAPPGSLGLVNTPQSSCLSVKDKKVKQSHYRPWQALRVPGGWGSQILRHLAHEGSKVVSPTHQPPLPPGNVSVRGWVDPRAIVQPAGLCQWKNPVTPSRIEPTTFQFVAQCSTTTSPCAPSAKDNMSEIDREDVVVKLPGQIS